MGCCDPSRPMAGREWRALGLVLSCMVCLQALAQDVRGDAPEAPAENDTTTLDTIRVTAPRMEMKDLYRSREPESTRPTVFDRAWREPLNLKKIGDEGGVVPLLVNYAARKVAEGARRIPGWKGPDQPAVARPPPLDDAQMSRAAQLQEAIPPE